MHFPQIAPPIMAFSWWLVVLCVGIWGGLLAYYLLFFHGGKREARSERKRAADAARMHLQVQETRGAERDRSIDVARMAREDAEAAAEAAEQAVSEAAARDAARKALQAAERSQDAAIAASMTARAMVPHEKRVVMMKKGERISTEADTHAAAAQAAAARAVGAAEARGAQVG